VIHSVAPVVAPPAFAVFPCAGSCARSPHPTLASGASGSLVFTVTVSSTTSGTITNSVVISTTTPDLNPTNNGADEPTTVQQADVTGGRAAGGDGDGVSDEGGIRGRDLGQDGCGDDRGAHDEQVAASEHHVADESGQSVAADLAAGVVLRDDRAKRGQDSAFLGGGARVTANLMGLRSLPVAPWKRESGSAQSSGRGGT